MTDGNKKSNARMLTSHQVAEQLSMSEQTLRKWRHMGIRGPKFIKLEGGAVRYRQVDVDAWLNTQNRSPIASK